MSPTEFVPIACSLVSVSCAVFVTVRAGNWRQSDAAKELDGRISDIADRVRAVEIRQEDLPSKADVSSLKTTLEGLKDKTTAIDAAVFRIEDHFIRNYGGPR